MRTAQELIWVGAGRPIVRGPTGEPLPTGDYGECAFCHGKAAYRVKDCVSSNFVIAKRFTLGQKGLCAPCAFALRDLRLRCAPWFASESGVRFCLERWGIFDFLTNPPEPPFAAGIPWFGMGKGGQKNWQFARVWHPDREEQPLSPAKVDENGKVTRAPQIMNKLQSKHTAIFAEIAASRDVYPLAIDDMAVVDVDVALWRRLAVRITEALKYIPVPCLEEWRPPSGGAQWETGILRWRELTQPLEPYRESLWWPLLLAIVPRPERPELEAKKDEPGPPEPEPKKAAKPSPTRSAVVGQLTLF